MEYAVAEEIQGANALRVDDFQEASTHYENAQNALYRVRDHLTGEVKEKVDMTIEMLADKVTQLKQGSGPILEAPDDYFDEKPPPNITIQGVDQDIVDGFLNAIEPPDKEKRMKRIADRKIAKWMIRQSTATHCLNPKLYDKVKVGSNVILMYGPSGVGKTMLAEAILGRFGETFEELSKDEIQEIVSKTKYWTNCEIEDLASGHPKYLPMKNQKIKRKTNLKDWLIAAKVVGEKDRQEEENRFEDFFRKNSGFRD